VSARIYIVSLYSILLILFHRTEIGDIQDDSSSRTIGRKRDLLAPAEGGGSVSSDPLNWLRTSGPGSFIRRSPETLLLAAALHAWDTRTTAIPDVSCPIINCHSPKLWNLSAAGLKFVSHSLRGSSWQQASGGLSYRLRYTSQLLWMLHFEC